MRITDFDIKLDDLTFDLNAEIQGLDPEKDDDLEIINQLELMKREINEVQSSLLKYQRIINKRKCYESQN